MLSVASGSSGSFIIGALWRVWIGLTVSRQTALNLTGCRRKKVIFYRQKWRFKLTVKNFQGISYVNDLTASTDLNWILAPEEFLNWQTQNPFSCFRIASLTRPYNLLVSKNISKFYKWKAKTISKTQQLIIISEVEVTVKSPPTATSLQEPLFYVPADSPPF